MVYWWVWALEGMGYAVRAMACCGGRALTGGDVRPGGLQADAAEDLRTWWAKKYSKVALCTLASSEADLPSHAVPIRVSSGEKRMNPRRRKALLKKKGQL